MTTVKGVLFPDTNHWHPLNDAGAVKKAGSPCVAMKVGQTSLDTAFEASRSKAEAAGLIVIGYIFGTNRRGFDQAADLASWFPWKPGRIWCLDNESNPSGDSITQAQAAECVTALHDLHPEGLWPIEYRLGTTPQHGKGPQWIAAYRDPPPPSGADIWQFYGGVTGPNPHIWPGVGGPACDMNQLVASVAALNGWAGVEEDELNAEEKLQLKRVQGFAKGIGIATGDVQADESGSYEAAGKKLITKLDGVQADLTAVKADQAAAQSQTQADLDAIKAKLGI